MNARDRKATPVIPPAPDLPLEDSAGILQRGQLLRRLTCAAGVLAGQRMYDGHRAVLEAIEIIRALPYADTINNALYPGGSFDPSKSQSNR